jgi:ribosomal protein L6P/L9E
MHLFKIYNAFVINFLFGLYKNYHIYFRLKGIGYKMMKIGLNFLLKIGFSHRIIYLIKKNLRFSYQNKQLLKIESRSLFNLKNIIFIFQKIRKINCYKKKGIFLKGSMVKIKINKKKAKV